MNCQEFRNRFYEYLSGELSPGETDAAGAHVHQCADCQRMLVRRHAMRAALRSQPVPPPSPGFFEQALRQARKPEPAQTGLWTRFAGAAAAAAVVVWLVVSGVPGVSDRDRFTGVTIALHETRTVQLALDAERSMDGAMLHIQLPQGVELQGFPGQREIRWRTNLARGVNMLSLPLTAVGATNGSLLARLEHGDRSIELSVRINVSEALRAPQV